MAISVGSVEVDIIPNTQGIYERLKTALVVAGTKAGEDAGNAAGRAFGPAMASSVSSTVAAQIGHTIGSQIGDRIAAQIRDAMRAGITVGGQQARVAAARQGEDSGGAFARMFRSRVEAAVRNLPKANVRIGDTGFNADMDRLRAKLEVLANKRVGVDVDAATALAEIDRLEAELVRLGAQHPDVNVRVDTAASRAALAALRADIARMDGDDIDIDANVHVAPAVASLSLLTTAAAAFGPAILPALPVVAAGLGLVAAAAVGAGVGLAGVAAVALPAFKQISGALSAQKAAQDAVSTSTSTGSSKALQMAGAQQALAAAHRSGAQQIASAQDQVRQASRGVLDAEKQLTTAQKEAKQAQADLTAARKQAAQELEDLANKYADAQLAQRDAALAVTEAQAELKRVNADAKSTALDKQKALLAADQAVQRLKEQTLETGRLKVEQSAAAKAGVAGSTTVRTAQDRLAKAQDNVADRTRGVADAQNKVVQAQQGVARAQQQAADSIASAQRQVASSSAQAAGGVDAAAQAQAKYRAELAKMTPATRATFNAFVGLRGAFGAWSKSLQPAVMPIFTRGLIGMKNALPSFTPFVYAAVRGITALQDKVSAGFKSPWWKTFKADLASSIEPAITGLGTAFGHIFIGMAGIIDAFLPKVDTFGQRMDKVTGRFARFGTGLKGSPAFERFLAYSSEQAPLLAETLGNLFGALVRLGVALAPMAGTAQSFLNAISAGVEAIPLKVLTVAGVAFASIAIGSKLAAAGVALWEGAMAAASVVTALLTGETLALNAAQKANLIGIIVTAIAALVVAVIYAYQNWGWFRNAVQSTWKAIQDAALWAWNNVLKPTFNALAAIITWLYNNVVKPYFAGVVLYFHIVADVAIWLWQNILSPAFSAIGAIFSAWWFGVKVYFALVWEAMKGIGWVATWLWQNSLAPAFHAMGAIFALWWSGVKLYASVVMAVFRAIGDAAMWLWSHAISPAFGWIGDKAGWVWSHAIKPAFDAIKYALGKVSDAFDLAKDAIGKAWDQIGDLAKRPIKFIIDHVYNEGIRPLWNKVAGLVDDKHSLDVISTSGWSTGGILPGYTPGRDVHLAALSGGEAVMRPEWTRAVGSGYVNAMNATASRGGVGAVRGALGLPAFKDGGIFGTITGAVKGAVNTGIDWAKTGADLLTNPGKIWDKLAAPIRNLIKGAGTSPWAKLAGGVPVKMLGALKDRVVSAAGSIFGGGGSDNTSGAGVQRWAPLVVRALGLLGQPASWLQTVLRRMNQESGGNPMAINNWDSNALAGDPSRGLMQTIGSTFNAYAGPFRGAGIYDPFANIYAGLNYAIHRYGSLSALNRPGGYDSGGYLQPGLNLAYNGTGRPEPVFTTQQANALQQSANNRMAPTLGDVNVRVFVGDREITDIARTEVNFGMEQLAGALNAGRN